MPFTVSPTAEAHLCEVLRDVAETVPEMPDLVPALCRGRSRTTWTWRGASAMPEYSDEEYSVRFYRPELVADWPRVQVPSPGRNWPPNPRRLPGCGGLHLGLTGAIEGEPLSGQVVARRQTLAPRQSQASEAAKPDNALDLPAHLGSSDGAFPVTPRAGNLPSSAA